MNSGVPLSSPGGTVELRLVGVHDDGVVRDDAGPDLGGHVRVEVQAVDVLSLVDTVRLAVVDARLRDLERAGGRNVAHDEVGLAGLAERRGGAHHRAVAVGVDDGAVHPVLRGVVQAALEELARAEKHLPVLAVHDVAVHVHVQERVVEAQVLQLVQHGLQRARVPQAYVPDRLRAPGDALRQRRLVHVVQPRVHAPEVEAAARPLDVALDVGALALQLGRRDGEALRQRGPSEPGDYPRDEPQPERGEDEPERLPQVRDAYRVEHDAGGEQGDDGEHEQRGQARVHVGVGRAGHRARGGEERLVAVEEVRERDGHHEPRARERQLRARAGADGRVYPACAEDEQVQPRRRDEGDEGEAHQPSLDGVQHGQDERVEAHVVVELRVLDAEVGGVHEQQEVAVLVRQAGRERERDESPHRDRAHDEREPYPLDRRQREAEDALAPRVPERGVVAQPERAAADQQAGDEEPDAREQHRAVDAAQTQV